MKHGKKLTRVQRIFIQDIGLNPNHWLIIKNLPDKLVLLHKERGTLAAIEVYDGQAI